jgi:hypothetical protein
MLADEYASLGFFLLGIAALCLVFPCRLSLFYLLLVTHHFNRCAVPSFFLIKKKQKIKTVRTLPPALPVLNAFLAARCIRTSHHTKS